MSTGGRVDKPKVAFVTTEISSGGAVENQVCSHYPRPSQFVTLPVVVFPCRGHTFSRN